jgi:hypothetical protein
MKTRRFVVALSVVVALVATSPARADWTNPDPGPNAGELSMEDMVLAAQWGFQIAQVAL